MPVPVVVGVSDAETISALMKLENPERISKLTEMFAELPSRDPAFTQVFLLALKKNLEVIRMPNPTGAPSHKVGDLIQAVIQSGCFPCMIQLAKRLHIPYIPTFALDIMHLLLVSESSTELGRLVMNEADLLPMLVGALCQGLCITQVSACNVLQSLLVTSRAAFDPSIATSGIAEALLALLNLEPQKFISEITNPLGKYQSELLKPNANVDDMAAFAPRFTEYVKDRAITTLSYLLIPRSTDEPYKLSLLTTVPSLVTKLVALTTSPLPSAYPESVLPFKAAEILSVLAARDPQDFDAVSLLDPRSASNESSAGDAPTPAGSSPDGSSPSEKTADGAASVDSACPNDHVSAGTSVQAALLSAGVVPAVVSALENLLDEKKDDIIALFRGLDRFKPPAPTERDSVINCLQLRDQTKVPLAATLAHLSSNATSAPHLLLAVPIARRLVAYALSIPVDSHYYQVAVESTFCRGIKSGASFEFSTLLPSYLDSALALINVLAHPPASTSSAVPIDLSAPACDSMPPPSEGSSGLLVDVTPPTFRALLADRCLKAKAKGAEAFKKQEVMFAAAWYSVALTLNEPANHAVAGLLLSNRSECLLRGFQYKAALRDAESAILLLDPQNEVYEKTVRRKERAMAFLEGLTKMAEAGIQDCQVPPQ